MNSPATTSPRRAYRLGARAESMQATRERILDAVDEAMRTSWYDELTFADLARAAGVSGPTLTNHFGDKHGLIAGLHARAHEGRDQRAPLRDRAR